MPDIKADSEHALDAVRHRLSCSCAAAYAWIPFDPQHNAN